MNIFTIISIVFWSLMRKLYALLNIPKRSAQIPIKINKIRQFFYVCVWRVIKHLLLNGNAHECSPSTIKQNRSNENKNVFGFTQTEVNWTEFAFSTILNNFDRLCDDLFSSMNWYVFEWFRSTFMYHWRPYCTPSLFFSFVPSLVLFSHSNSIGDN